MTDKKDFGNKGEEIAARYLADSGFIIHHRNWRSLHHEVDIVAEWHGEIVFVEVKTRRSEAFMTALSAVDRKKRNNLILAARHYMNYFYNGEPRPYRFDIITVVGEGPQYEVSHYRRAFSTNDYQPEGHSRKEIEW